MDNFKCEDLLYFNTRSVMFQYQVDGKSGALNLLEKF